MTDGMPSDDAMIREHLHGSSTALAQLWLRYDSLVYGLAHSVLCSRDAAEDIRQEVFLKVYARLGQLREGAKFASWVSSITYNTCRSWLRRRRPTRPLEALPESEHPSTAIEPDLERREQRTLLRRMIDRLHEADRTVVELHYFEGQHVAEIAEFLDLPESTVKWRIHRAREALKRTAEINGYLE